MPRKPTGNPNGRPPFKPTDDERRKVEIMSMVGTPHDDIAFLLGIDADTLKKHFKRELRTGGIEANTNIGGRVYKAAMEGNVAALKWWTQARMGWKETSVQETVNIPTHEEALIELCEQGRIALDNQVINMIPKRTDED